ncbi:MAG: hypothetical protein P1P88_11425 [Bacteroidales bacterium]|nr:hypothetical protein [Bacteroidales bacterium]
MKNKFKILLGIIFFPMYVYAQNIEIKYIGNCAYKIKLDSVEIFTDFPYESGAYGYMEYILDSVNLNKSNQYLLFTHQHKDHYSSSLVKKAGLKKYRPRMPKRKKKQLFQELETKFGIAVKVFKTKHRYSIKHNSLAIEWKGRRVFIFGDTENDFPEYLHKNYIDLMFITSWQLPKLKQKNKDYNIKNMVIYHLPSKESGNRKQLTEYMDYHLSFLTKKLNYVILNQYENEVLE